MKLFGNLHVRKGTGRKGTEHKTGFEASPSFGDSDQRTAEEALQPSTWDPAKKLNPVKSKFSVGMVVRFRVRMDMNIKLSRHVFSLFLSFSCACFLDVSVSDSFYDFLSYFSFSCIHLSSISDNIVQLFRQ